MFSSLKASAAVAATAMTLVAGAAVALPSVASAEVYACGLIKQSQSYGGPGVIRQTWSIRNCHSYSVRRKIVVHGGTDGGCYTYAPGGQRLNTIDLVGGAYVEGMNDC